MVSQVFLTILCPITFMRLTKKVFLPFIWKFFVVYFNDILIYSLSYEGHLQHLYEVFKALRVNKLYANLNKYIFMTNFLIFMSFFVSFEGINKSLSTKSENFSRLADTKKSGRSSKLWLLNNILQMIFGEHMYYFYTYHWFFERKTTYMD